MELHIGRDFYRYPACRYRSGGQGSGEAFREDHLIPALRTAIETGQKLVVVIDDVSAPASFIHEAFAKLSAHGITREHAQSHLSVMAIETFRHHYAILAIRYLIEGFKKHEKGTAG